MRYFLIIIPVLFLSAAKGQDLTQDTITWNAIKAVNQIDNSEIVSGSSFITFGNQAVDWVQKGVTAHYTVTQVNGSWSSLANDGSLTYSITGAGGNLSGSITFSRNEGKIYLHLKTQIEDNGLDLVFPISSTQSR